MLSLSDKSRALVEATLPAVAERIPEIAKHFYRHHLCGPIPFMHEVHSALTKRGIQPRDIQYEVFGPDLWHADYE